MISSSRGQIKHDRMSQNTSKHAIGKGPLGLWDILIGSWGPRGNEKTAKGQFFHKSQKKDNKRGGFGASKAEEGD